MNPAQLRELGKRGLFGNLNINENLRTPPTVEPEATGDMCRAMELEMENGAAASPLNNDGDLTRIEEGPLHPKGPKLLEQALAAVAKKGKKRAPLGYGDVVIVLDAEDLSKTILLEEKILTRQVPNFFDRHVLDGTSFRNEVASDGGIRYLLVLSKSGSAEEMPTLERRALNTAAPGPKLSGDGLASEVKQEPEADSAMGNDNVQQQRGLKGDWVKAYDCFFRVMVTSSVSIKHVKLPASASSALPLLEAVVVIAEHYSDDRHGCIQAVGSAFKSLCNDWISNRTLYAAVAVDPARWLVLAIKLENVLVYKEAFVHLVGQYPDIAGPVEKIPAEIMANIASEARELRIKRYEADQSLFMTTLKVAQNGKAKLAAIEGTVSHHHAPMIYHVVNVWRDWIAEHLTYIHDDISHQKLPDSTPFCDHLATEREGSPGCLTIAGIYRLLSKGGDAYLSADVVVEKWNRDVFGRDTAVIRSNLVALKEHARKLVAPLVRSSLQYAERDGLRYLTCVEVGKVPWATEEDEDVDMED